MKTTESIKDNDFGMGNVMTIDLFNKLTRQETLHPLVTIANMGNDMLKDDVDMPCDFYALLLSKGTDDEKDALRLVCPGEMFKMPSASHSKGILCTGILFHPDLLCEHLWTTLWTHMQGDVVAAEPCLNTTKTSLKTA